MVDHRRGPTSPGGIDDPVAQNIRREQNLAAAPSKAETEALHRKHLASEGCRDCGEDDPDELVRVAVPLPACSAVQRPNDPYYVTCFDCDDGTESVRERALTSAQAVADKDERQRVHGVLQYHCGRCYTATTELDDIGGGNYYPDSRGPPTAPVECRCGAALDEYIPIADFDDELYGDGE